MSRATNRPPVILVGMMGSGKSTTAPLLAAALSVRDYDLDSLIEEDCGRSIADIFRYEGESEFRQREQAMLRRVLQKPEPAVIALGGGAVTDPNNRALLRSYPVIWLDADIGVMWARVHGSERPLLNAGGRERLSELAEARQSEYSEVSRLRIDTTNLDPEDVVRIALNWILTAEGEASQ